MTTATLQQEMEAAACQCTAAITPSGPTQVMSEPPPASVVSPPSTTNLNALLSGQVGQECLGTDADTSTITADSEAVKENSASSNKKKKKTNKLSSSKRGSFGSILKKGRFATTSASKAASVASSKVFNYKRVYYEARLELKGDDRYAAYFKQIGLLFKNIQLVNPTAIMHAFVELETAKPLGSKSEMNNNMAIFLSYALFGSNFNVLNPRRITTKRRAYVETTSPI